MESTGIYWMPIWRLLESDFKLYLVNLYTIKQLPGRKSDSKNAEWLATCQQKDFIRGSYVPGDTIQQLRQYNCRVFDVTKQLVYIQSKMDAALQRCNIRLSYYVSNVDTKSYREVVRLLSEGETRPDELIKKIHGRTINRCGRENVLTALQGVVPRTDMDMLEKYVEELEMYRRYKAHCLLMMKEICKEYYQKLEHLQTILSCTTLLL